MSLRERERPETAELPLWPGMALSSGQPMIQESLSLGDQIPAQYRWVLLPTSNSGALFTNGSVSADPIRLLMQNFWLYTCMCCCTTIMGPV